jgi:hypothetical protein
MDEDKRSLVGKVIDTSAGVEKSPLTAGFVAGLKAALWGAPLGAGIQAVRGKDAVTGAAIGALAAGILAAISRSGQQKVQNLGAEASLRYHAGNIKDREPLFFMPPRQYMRQYFTRRYED